MSVGKTSICNRYYSGEYTGTHEPTIGGCFFTKDVELESHICKFEIWDTAGQERYRSLAQMYYKKAIAALVVYDVTNADSFEKSKLWIKELQEKAPANIHITLCANKIDLDNR